MIGFPHPIPSENSKTLQWLRLWNWQLSLQENLFLYKQKEVPMAKKKRKQLLPNRIYKVTVRLNESELDYLDRATEQLNITRSEYLRNLVLDKPMIYTYEIVANDADLRKLTGEIGKIGSNLNQIAKHLNTGGIRSMMLQEEVHRCTAQLFELRKKLLELAGDHYGNLETHNE